MTKPLTKDLSLKVAAPPVDASVETPLDAIHDASQQVKNLRHVLEEGKQRIGCFLAISNNRRHGSCSYGKKINSAQPYDGGQVR